MKPAVLPVVLPHEEAPHVKISSKSDLAADRLQLALHTKPPLGTTHDQEAAQKLHTISCPAEIDVL